MVSIRRSNGQSNGVSARRRRQVKRGGQRPVPEAGGRRAEAKKRTTKPGIGEGRNAGRGRAHARSVPDVEELRYNG